MSFIRQMSDDFVVQRSLIPSEDSDSDSETPLTRHYQKRFADLLKSSLMRRTRSNDLVLYSFKSNDKLNLRLAWSFLFIAYVFELLCSHYPDMDVLEYMNSYKSILFLVSMWSLCPIYANYYLLAHLAK